MKKIVLTLGLILAAIVTFSKNQSHNKNMKDMIITVSWSTLVEQHYIIVNNCRIRYLTAGAGSPLLLIHTVRTQSDLFQKVIPVLAKHYRVYAIDLPGHGGSGMPNEAYSEPYFRACVIGFIDQLELKQVTIAGESIGAVLALTIAATDKAKNVKEVFAFNPYDYDKKSGIRRSSKTARNVFNALRIPLINLIVSNGETDTILKKILYGGLLRHDSLSNDLVKLIGSTREQKGFARAFRSIVHNNASWVKARSLYPHITIPVTLIYGSADWSKEDERQANKRLIPGNKFFILNNTGHWSSLDSPRAFEKIILNHAHAAGSDNAVNYLMPN